MPSVAIFKRSKTRNAVFTPTSLFTVDVHSHILPNLDNGVETYEESIALLRVMSADGVQKVIATPHIMGEFYKNNEENIFVAKDKLLSEIQQKRIPIALEVGAEYFLDVSFVALLEAKQSLLTFGEKYVLFETTIINLPHFWKEAILKISQRGLVPVLAHPERYHYLQQSYSLAHQLHELGVLFQLNTTSLQSLHTSTRLLAEYLISEGLIDFMGSNTHGAKDWKITQNVLNSKYFNMAFERGLLNNNLL